MMRELDTVSPVVWPAWCYSGEGQGDLETIPGATELNQSAAVESPKSRGKRRGGGALKENRTAMNGSADVHNNNNSNNNNKNPPVKTERLSPATTDSPSAPGATMTATPDNNSSSSRSATPSSSYPGTPPTTERVGSPSGHIKHMEQMMTRNYSDFMRSLAAKYNNNNPNDYFSSPTRNGFGVGFDPRFSSFKSAATPFLGLVAPTAAPYKTAPNSSPSPAGSSKDDAKKDLSLYAAAANFGAGTFGSAAAAAAAASGGATTAMFPPLIDMSSTQALLNMARTASAHNASQLEIYLKGAIKRPPQSESSPLDLSSAALPSYGKKSRGNKSVSDSIFLNSDSLLHVPIVDALRSTKDKIGKRTGSVSPKPPPPATSRNSGASSAGSSPRLQPSSTMTSSTARHLPCLSMCTADRGCGGPESQAMAQWTVDDVCNFVTSIDVCAEYAPNFREQRIDGSSLPLLTEEHLTTTMGMKLGPALKLRATLARRLGHCAICLHCVHCHNVPTPSSPAQTPPAVIGRPSSAGN